MIKIRFQDYVMQTHYKDLVKGGMNWRKAESKTIKAFEEYDNGK